MSERANQAMREIERTRRMWALAARPERKKIERQHREHVCARAVAGTAFRDAYELTDATSHVMEFQK